MKNESINNHAAGFTLIEVMITLVIAMSILAGLFSNFTMQSSEYKYQDKRVDTTQDLEFAIRYIASDLQGALLSSDSTEVGSGASGRGITGLSAGSTASSFLSFTVWDTTVGAGPDFQVRRCYRFDAGMIKYDLDDDTCSAGTNIPVGSEIIGDVGEGLKVTNFRVFQDGLNDADRANYTYMPPPLPTKTYRNYDNIAFDIPAFSILIEVEVDATRDGTFVDVLGNNVVNNKQRIWRYMQVYPSVVLGGL